MNFVSKVFTVNEEFIDAISHDDTLFENCEFKGINIELATSEEGQSGSNDKKIVKYACFKNCSFEACKFSNLDFMEVDFVQCDFSDSKFNSLEFDLVTFRYSDMFNCTFNEVRLTSKPYNTLFEHCSLVNIHFFESILSRLAISHSELKDVHITKCVIPYASIIYSNMMNVCFNKCTNVSMYLCLSQINIIFNDAPKYPSIRFHYCDIRRFTVNGKKQYITQIAGIGQRNDCTTYNICTDNVRCGCWTTHEEDYAARMSSSFVKGGNLDEFRTRVQATYKSKDDCNSDDIAPSPDQIHHRNEYDAAIRFFKEVNESYKQMQLSTGEEVQCVDDNDKE